MSRRRRNWTATLEARFRRDTATLRGEPALLKAATLNWYVLYGDSLPGEPGGE